jgi:hypothetical protein
MSRGGASDPSVPVEVKRLRREVLDLLGGLGRDERGRGLTLSTRELADLLEPVMGVRPDVGMVGQAARWLALERAGGERVLFWRNAGDSGDARWGVTRERTDADVLRVLAAYDGRLAAHALARAADGAGEPDEVLAERVLRVGRSVNDAADEGARREGLVTLDPLCADCEKSANGICARDEVQLSECRACAELSARVDNRGPDSDTEDDAPGGPPYAEGAEVPESPQPGIPVQEVPLEDPAVNVWPDPPGKDALADSSVPSPGVARQRDLGLQMQNRPDRGSADEDLRQFGSKSGEVEADPRHRDPRAYDRERVRRVVELVKRTGPPTGVGWRALTTALWAATGRDPVGPAGPVSGVAEAVERLTAWERTNVLLGLKDYATEALSAAAATCRRTARALDEAERRKREEEADERG